MRETNVAERGAKRPLLFVDLPLHTYTHAFKRYPLRPGVVTVASLIEQSRRRCAVMTLIRGDALDSQIPARTCVLCIAS